MEHRAMDWPNAPVQADDPETPPDNKGKTGYDGEVPKPKPEPKKEKEG